MFQPPTSTMFGNILTMLCENSSHLINLALTDANYELIFWNRFGSRKESVSFSAKMSRYRRLAIGFV